MAVKLMLDITQEDQEILRQLLKQYLPESTVWLYGSRIKGNARHNSDLDMAVFNTKNQQAAVFDLDEALEESDLPFRVDLFRWEDMPTSFHQKIEREHYVFYQGREQSD